MVVLIDFTWQLVLATLSEGEVRLFPSYPPQTCVSCFRAGFGNRGGDVDLDHGDGGDNVHLCSIFD